MELSRYSGKPLNYVRLSTKSRELSYFIKLAAQAQTLVRVISNFRIPKYTRAHHSHTHTRTHTDTHTHTPWEFPDKKVSHYTAITGHRLSWLSPPLEGGKIFLCFSLMILLFNKFKIIQETSFNCFSRIINFLKIIIS